MKEFLSDVKVFRRRARSHSEYVAGGSLVEMIREDLVAERIAVEILLGDHPVVGRR
jgi:hypothetical protein